MVEHHVNEAATTLERYRAVFLLPGHEMDWYRQYRYVRLIKNPWTYRPEDASTHEWLRHLNWSDRFWLAWTCPRTRRKVATTEHFAFDVDAKTEDERAHAVELVGRIQGLLGEPWFITRTPSFGFHVYYHLDRRAELGKLITGEQTGALADRLLEVDLRVGKAAKLEMYPQGKRCLRGPLGTDQTLLDPTTFAPLPIQNIEDAVTYVEGRQHQCVNVDDVVSGAIRPVGVSAVAPTIQHDAYNEGEALAFWRDGITSEGTRFRAQQQIIRGMLRAPKVFGLPEGSSDQVIGRAFADWLERWGHNSRDWAEKPSVTHWAAEGAYWARLLRTSEHKVAGALRTQASSAEVDLILDSSANGLDPASPSFGRDRLNRELMALGLINKAKYACAYNDRPIGRKSVVRLSAKEVLAKLPGSSMATYVGQLEWGEAIGLIESRGRSYSKRRRLAKEIVMDLDPDSGLTEAEVQVLFALHSERGYHPVRVAHAIQVLRRFDDATLLERYDGALPNSLVEAVRTRTAPPTTEPPGRANLEPTGEGRSNALQFRQLSTPHDENEHTLPSATVTDGEPLPEVA